MKTFKEKLALVTGGAQGVGRLLALGLGQRGCHVIVVDINGEKAQLVAAEVRALGVQAWHYELDISDLDAVKQLRTRVSQDIGRIDLLINNAGTVFGGNFESVPLEKHLLIYNVNIAGLVALTHCFFTDLLAGSDTHLVNMASAAGYVGLPYGSTFASSKAAVISFSDSIRMELAERNLTQLHVTTVSPSYINSDTFMGVRAPRLLPLLDPKFVAERILSAIQDNEVELREPFMVKALGLLKVLPTGFADKAAQRMGITRSMLLWTGR